MKLMPTLIRVSNVDQSIQFYSEALGLDVKRKKDYPAGRFTLASLGYDDSHTPTLELSQIWGENRLSKPLSSGDILIEVDDALRACYDSKYVKGEVIRLIPHTKQPLTLTAIVKDPDGHIVNLVEREIS